MDRFFKIVLSIIFFFSMLHFAMADRGVGKRNKNRIVLNISTTLPLRNSIQFNLKSGLQYKGSLLTSQQTIGNSIINTSIITYEKGNTIYIIPFKHKIIMPEMSQGYTGLKFIIH